jgi:hypothetical protein
MLSRMSGRNVGELSSGTSGHGIGELFRMSGG